MARNLTPPESAKDLAETIIFNSTEADDDGRAYIEPRSLREHLVPALSSLLEERKKLREALEQFLAPTTGKPAYPSSYHGIYVTGQTVLLARAALSPKEPAGR